MSKIIKCPKCEVDMKVIRHEDLETDECPKCGGIWIDKEEKKQALQMKPQVFTQEDYYFFHKMYKPQGKIEEVKYYKCPHCQELMWRKNFMHHSGVIVDKCQDHGIFFDKGELEQAIEFIKKGGAEYEKLKLTNKEIAKTQSKLVRELTRVESTMYKLHWTGRFLSSMRL